MKRFLAGLAMMLFFLATAGMAHAVILTFDNIPGGSVQDSYGSIGSYAGFDFHALGSTDRLDWIDTVGSVWNFGAVSGDFTVLNNHGGSGRIVSSSGDDFTFSGLWARVWGDTYDRAVSIEGYNNGDLTWSHNLTLTTNWTYFSGYSGVIDDLRLNFGNHFLVDNLALNESKAVPIPTAILLFAPGLAGLMAAKRRFKK